MMIGMNAKFIREARLEEELGHSLVVKEPIGVVGCVTPWNYPLHQVVCKIAPGAGRRLHRGAEACRDGAAQRVHAGRGRARDRPARRACSTSCRARAAWSARPSSAHPDVDMVSFTGSLQAGRRIAAVAGDGIKKVCLELGGKSAFVVLDDAPFDKADCGGREQLHAELRADLLGVDAHAGAAGAARRGRGAGQRPAGQADARRSVRREHAARAARVGRAARQRARLHRAGQEGRRDARGRRRPAVAPAEGVLRRADDLRERGQPHDHRAGGDLRTGAV